MNTKKIYKSQTKPIIRIIVWILIAAMLVGTCYYFLFFAFINSSVYAESDEAEDDLRIRIALIYGSSVQDDFKTDANNGFLLGYNDGNVFNEIFSTDVSAVNISCDKNLKKSGDRYIVAANVNDSSVGSYHVKIKCESESSFEYFDDVKKLFSTENVFPAYYDGTKCIMIGQFAEEAEAKQQLEILKSSVKEMPDMSEDTTAPVTKEKTSENNGDSLEPATVIYASQEFIAAVSAATVTANSSTAIKVINPSDSNIIWAFDDTTKATAFGIKAKQTRSEYTYIKGYKENTKFTYDDTLECSVYETDDSFGIQVINVLSLETYIAGVIPYEIGNSWPIETQKAFAIAARSYAVANLGRHKSAYNSDLCCTANCQVYKGFGSTNSTVRRAVQETKGIIAVYKDKICSTFYSSSTGGCTVNVSQVWGSSQSYYGYLYARSTPWEKYESYGNGSWTSSATGAQLYERLKSQGYTGLSGAVTKVEIVKLAENSSYVYSIKFSDAKGKSVTVSRVDKVKSLLSPYVKSGNFIVAKGGSTVERQSFTMLGFGQADLKLAEGVSVKTNPFDYSVIGRQNFSVITNKGIQSFTDSNSESVITSSGIFNFGMSEALDGMYYPTLIGVNGKVLPDINKLESISIQETVTATGNSNTFVFIGRGWGHGVGLSQWGIKDLGDLGYDYETILKAYYTNIDLIQYKTYLENK